MPRKYHRYTEDDKAQALAFLAANRGNYKAAAKQTGIPASTIQNWQRGIGINSAVTKIDSENRGPLADRLEALAHAIADSIPNKIDESNLRDAAISMGVIVDKMRLLREQPTTINADAMLTDDERSQRIAALLESARARRDRSSASGGTEETP